MLSIITVYGLAVIWMSALWFCFACANGVELDG
jgi:hypothetical protein